MARDRRLCEIGDRRDQTPADDPAVREARDLAAVDGLKQLAVFGRGGGVDDELAVRHAREYAVRGRRAGAANVTAIGEAKPTRFALKVGEVDGSLAVVIDAHVHKGVERMIEPHVQVILLERFAVAGSKGVGTRASGGPDAARTPVRAYAVNCK